jgi:hypothetical protein
LLANDQLLKCKGFLLFTVDDNGTLNMCGDSACLNPAEQWGLENYANHNTITRKISAVPGIDESFDGFKF